MELAKRQRSIPCVRSLKIFYNYYKNHLERKGGVIIMIEYIKQVLTRLKFIRSLDLERVNVLTNNGSNYFNELQYLLDNFREIKQCDLGNLVIRFWVCSCETSMSIPRQARWPMSVVVTTITRPILVRSTSMSTTTRPTTTTIMWVVWCRPKPVQDSNKPRRITATKIESICNLFENLPLSKSIIMTAA